MTLSENEREGRHVQKKNAAPVSELRLCSLALWVDEPVGAVFAAVNDADVVGVCVEEDEEIVVEEFHLHDGFFDVHGFNGEGFLLGDDFRRFFNMSDFIGSRGEHWFSLGLFAFAVHAGFVLANLTFDLVDDGVDGGVHVVGRFFSAKNVAAQRNGCLCSVIAFLEKRFST